MASCSRIDSASRETPTSNKADKGQFAANESDQVLAETALEASTAKRRHVSRSNTSETGKRRKSLVTPQRRLGSVQGRPSSKIVHNARRQFNPEVENQNGQQWTNGGTVSNAGLPETVPVSPVHCLDVNHDIISYAIKQHQQVCENYLTEVQDHPFDGHSAFDEGCQDLQTYNQLSAAPRITVTLANGTGSSTAQEGASATYHAQTSTTSDGLVADCPECLKVQSLASGTAGGDDNRDNSNGRRKPFKIDETEAADDGERRMLHVCAKFHQRAHLQLPETHGSHKPKDPDIARQSHGRSCSCSNNETENTASNITQRSESAPAQAQCPRRFNKDGVTHEVDTLSEGRDDPHLRQALIRRASMVRASDITGEPSVDAPWVHHMRPSSLILLHRGHEGYGGHGELAQLPAKSPCRRENQQSTREELLVRRGSVVMDGECAVSRGSFSFAESGSFISQREAFAGGLLGDISDTRSQEDPESVISQHTALVAGPSANLVAAGALLDREILDIRFTSTTTSAQRPALVEAGELRRPSIPHMAPPILSDSVSTWGGELPNYKRSQIGNTPHNTVPAFTKRRRQRSSWSSVLCCIGDFEGDGQSSSSDNEIYSAETARSQKPITRRTNQVPETRETHPAVDQENGTEQRPAPAVANPEACDGAPAQTSAATDGLANTTFSNNRSNSGAVMSSSKCPRTRFAEKNQRWRDPTPKE